MCRRPLLVARDELWRLPMTEEEVFELVSPADVRRLRRDKPSNLLTLVDTAVCQLCLVVQRPSPAYFGHALNCVRILTRTLPFLLEQVAVSCVFFWGGGKRKGASGKGHERL